MMRLRDRDAYEICLIAIVVSLAFSFFVWATVSTFRNVGKEVPKETLQERAVTACINKGGIPRIDKTYSDEDLSVKGCQMGKDYE